MPKKFLKKHMPNATQLHERCNIFSLLGDHIHQPSLWHLNRRSVAKAFAIGLFCTWLPVPFQTLIAAFIAILACANLPLSVILVFVSNPITIPPMFYFAYKVGSVILGTEIEPMNFEFSMEWFNNIVGNSWQPLVIGCLLLGTISSALGYIAIRVIWRLHIIQRWQNRKKQQLDKL